MAEEAFNYKEKSAPKLSDEFKRQYIVNIKGKDAIKVEGLTIIAHQKGVWKLDVDVIQFPTAENKWMCICKATVGGYDWDPIQKAVREVVYTDIADASPENCTSMVAKSYIRMASTRAIGRVLRKYTNVDMLCSSEMEEVVETQSQIPQEPLVTVEQLSEIKVLLSQKGVSKDTFFGILNNVFHKDTHMKLTVSEGDNLINQLRQMQDVAPQPQQSMPQNAPQQQPNG